VVRLDWIRGGHSLKLYSSCTAADSRFVRPVFHCHTNYNRFRNTLLPRLIHPCRITLDYPFFLRRKLPKFVLARPYPPPQGTEYMLVFTKVTVEGHVSKHARDQCPL